MASDVVTDMFPFIILSFILWYAYVYDFVRYLLSKLLACSCAI